MSDALQDMKSSIDQEEEFGKDSRSPVNVFNLPTGVIDGEGKLVTEIELQEMTGNEEDLIAAKDLSAHQRMNGVMKGCIKRIGDVSDKGQVAEFINNMVSNDRFFIIYKIREISLGDKFQFKAPCPECKDDSQVRETLISEVICPGLKEPMKRIYVGKMPSSGKEYKWLVSTGKTESQASVSAKRTKNDLFSAMLLQRVGEIDGMPADIKALKTLSVRDRNHLRQEIEGVEGIVDDEIIIECNKCEHEFSVEADIGRKEFFFPTAQ